MDRSRSNRRGVRIFWGLAVCQPVPRRAATYPISRDSSFIAGVEDRICARLDALREEKQSAIQKATGRSLVVIKGAQIAEDFKATGIRRSTGGSGYANGQAAGGRLPFSSGVDARRSAGMLT